MASYSHQSAFEKAIGGFKEGLRRREIDDFKSTTLDELRTGIITLQATQHSKRELRNLNRLQPFLEATEQYAEVIREFCDNDDIVAFLWGPLKFLIQRTSGEIGAFCELLGAYEKIGESLPLLIQYRNAFHTKPHLVTILSDIYADILEFQTIILRYFQQPQWKQVFAESWSTCNDRFPSIAARIAHRKSLVESEAPPARIEEVQREIQQERTIVDDQFGERDLHRSRDVYNWLKASNMETYQDDFSNIRKKYPGTGRWLLENNSFKEWFDPRFPTIPPLLWINGMPGAGKTFLASLVIEEAQNLRPRPTVLYFYCKQDNSERNNFVALGRSLLAQFLKQDNGLLPTFYQKSCRSGEATLTSPALVQELLNLAFGNCKSAYIIIDGIDECPRDQRKYISQWFRKLVEDLPNSEPERLRCLFVSQDDGVARKDFAGLTSIKVGAEDNKNDIAKYCQSNACVLKDNFALTDERASEIASAVATSVKGLFLLARLIWENLERQVSIAAMEHELEPNVFPLTINDAYRRIFQQIPQEALEETKRLLGWLVCAKRPLQWHEIQVMKSVNLKDKSLDFDQQSFMKSPKELCGSLLETRSDGTIELIHLTAKFFLTEEVGVDPAAEELKIAAICIGYLDFPLFTTNEPTKDRVLNGDYALMDYAVLNWLPHLEAGATLVNDGCEELMQEIAVYLGSFIEHHWASPIYTFTLAKRHSEKLEFFRSFDYYKKLETAVAFTRKQLRDFGKMKKEEFALDLFDVVGIVRKILEGMTSRKEWDLIKESYGDCFFKCPRFSCSLFTKGFKSSEERDNHIKKHERPFRCSEENCVMNAYGFASASERDKHMGETHAPITFQDEEFPTESEVQRSMTDRNPPPEPVQEIVEAVSTAAVEDPDSGTASEAEPQYMPRQKRQRQTEFKCQHCGKVFKKRYNLKSHLNSHMNERPHICHICDQQFARSADHKRHLRTHTGENKSICRGCRKSFARADTLEKHYESKVGRVCFQRQREQERERLFV
ncbi:putative zinc finger protein [Rostrohypoxylon terebratum]|nr:putative zinc finger protein [Rostrohypoxylon terebratum]